MLTQSRKASSSSIMTRCLPHVQFFLPFYRNWSFFSALYFEINFHSVHLIPRHTKFITDNMNILYGDIEEELLAYIVISMICKIVFGILVPTKWLGFWSVSTSWMFRYGLTFLLTKQNNYSTTCKLVTDNLYWSQKKNNEIPWSNPTLSTSKSST